MKKNILKFSLGIDVSKADLDCNLSYLTEELEVKVKASRKFKNTPVGISQLITWAKKHMKEADIPVIAVVEATGVYHENIAYSLDDNNFDVAIVLPNLAKKYIESLGYKSKNDKIDAKGLAYMGAERMLRKWERPSKALYMIRSLSRELSALQDKMTVTRNQIHALEHAYQKNTKTYNRLVAHLKFLQKQEVAIKKDIEKTLKKDEDLYAKVENIIAITGVGMNTVATIIGETNGFALIENAPQLVSYAGYDVVERQSGPKKGKTRISKKGNSNIRKALHFPAFNVVKYKVAPFKSFYDRLIENKKLKMVAYTAVQKKLLVIIYTLWKKNERFNPAYTYANDTNVDRERNTAGELKENSAPNQMDALHKITSCGQEASFDKNKDNELNTNHHAQEYT